MDLIATGIDNDSDRGLNQKTVISQLKDVKVMMKETLKGILKMKENVNNSNNLSNSPLVDKSEGEEDNNDDRDREETIGPYGVWGASVSIFADILLQMRFDIFLFLFFIKFYCKYYIILDQVIMIIGIL